jgi:hypothetical protein
LLKALHLGWITTSLNTVLALLEAEVEPVIINTELNRFFRHAPALPVQIQIASNLYENFDLPFSKLSRFGFVLSPVAQSIGRRLVRRMEDVIEAHEPIDFVFANWGVTVLPEVALFKQHKKTKDIPVVLNIETFPTSWEKGWRETLEITIFRQVAPQLSALIVPSAEMADTIRRIVPELSQKAMLLKPFYFSKQFVSIPAKGKMNRNDVVFMGQMDFSRSLNNVAKQLMALASAGLTLHCAPAEGLNHPNIKFFEPFGSEAFVSGEVASFIRQFRACLVTYNFPERDRLPLRFRDSLPSRFLIALAAGVPVLLPRNHFAAMERIVESEGMGYAYRDPGDAFRVVTGSGWDKVMEKAAQRSSAFVFDGKEFRQFLINVLRA